MQSHNLVDCYKWKIVCQRFSGAYVQYSPLPKSLRILKVINDIFILFQTASHPGRETAGAGEGALAGRAAAAGRAVPVGQRTRAAAGLVIGSALGRRIPN